MTPWCGEHRLSTILQLFLLSTILDFLSTLLLIVILAKFLIIKLLEILELLESLELLELFELLEFILLRLDILIFFLVFNNVLDYTYNAWVFSNNYHFDIVIV